MTEEEQIDAMKKWWSDNWKSLFGGIIIGLAILFGGKSWMQQNELHAAAASAEFEMMMQALSQDEKTVAADHAARILGQYVDTPYAVMAALAMAKIKVEENDLAAAKSHLRWALDHTSHAAKQHIARLRLARVLSAEGNHDEALKLVTSIEMGDFVASYEEVKGDIFVAKGDITQARNAYNIALAALQQSSRNRDNLQMKLDDLGETSAPSGLS